MSDTVDAFVELDEFMVRHSDIRAFFPVRDDDGKKIGKTMVACTNFHSPVIINLPYETVKALVLPQ